jgi:predicted glycoside hydrolase/deacetylase ChbG (UPF0249 family)
MDASRSLVVVADDFGIGPGTSRGILDLAGRGKVTATVLLVNSPHAEDAVSQWHRAGGPACVDLGWHACLTLDKPVLPPWCVPSLVGKDGSFLSLAHFAARLALGRIRRAEVRAEFQAQYERFVTLTGQAPALVNGHHHIQVFPGIGAVLLDVLASSTRQQPLPYVRRVRETLPLLAAIPRARLKRLVLATLGRRFAQQQRRHGFPGNDYLAGITDLRGLTGAAGATGTKGKDLLSLWLQQVPGRVVEFICHPGHADETLVGRDIPVAPLAPLAPRAAQAMARVRELELLERTSFEDVCQTAGFRLTGVSGVSRVSRLLTRTDTDTDTEWLDPRPRPGPGPEQRQAA